MENFILNSSFFDRAVIRLPEQDIDASQFSGSNQKNILIVCTKQMEHEKIDLDFLTKIFASVNFDLTNDASLMLIKDTQNFSWKAINEAIKFDHLIYFGDSLKNLGLQITGTHYAPFEYDKKTILIAESLDVIADDRGKKGSLWNGLKLTFNC